MKKIKKNIAYLFFVTICGGLLSQAVADSGGDKSQYHLFNPTPEGQMREFVTDRPDKTEAPITVDAGHFQHETDFVNATFNRNNGSTDSSYLIAAPNLKMGLTNNSDLQVVMESFNYVREDGVKQSGFGDILVRLKMNLWGNEGGDTALAVMPYVKFPTNHKDLGNDNLEGGVIVPMSISLSDTVGLGLMTQFDFVQNEDRAGHHVEFVNSATVGTDLIGDLGGYVELWTNASKENPFQATFDVGLTYACGDNTQFDIGLNTGITDGSDDFNPFIGISQRF
jgi:hypothetical protein